MAWGFKDWVRGRPFRRDPDELTLPENASGRALHAMALRILDNDKAYKAYQLLDKQPERARPVLESLLREDERFRRMDRNVRGWGEPVYAVIVRILCDWDSKYALDEALKLSESPDPKLRAIAARSLGATGRTEFGPTLLRLSEDKNLDVRVELAHGIDQVINNGKGKGRILEPELARVLYKFMRDCALTTYGGPGGEFVATLFKTDREAASRDFDPKIALTPDRVWLDSLITTLQAEGIAIPHSIVLALLNHALATVNRSDYSTREHSTICRRIPLLLKLHADFDRTDALQQLDSLRKHPQEDVRQAALQASDDLLGEPLEPAFIAFGEAGGIDGLRTEHANVCLVTNLDGEVCNGGWLQWIANSSGRYANETLKALRAIGADAAAEQLEQVISSVGPDGSSPDQRTRMAAIDRMMNAGKELPDDGIMWSLSTDLRLLMRDYAARHPDAFPRKR